jgi:hypothetical protein
MSRQRRIALVVRKFRLGEEPKENDFWRTQTPVARVAALEEIRREHHGWKHGAEPRLQRVFSVVKR